MAADSSSAAAARLRLKTACAALIDQLTTRWTYETIASRAGLGVGTVAKLVADGDKTGWRVPSPTTCAKVDALAQRELSYDPGLTILLRNFREAEAKAGHDMRVRYGYAPARAVALQDRSHLLDKVLINDDGSTVLTSVAVGDGGVGKSQLARALWDQCDRESTEAQFWITASSRPSVIAGYAAAASVVSAALDNTDAETAASAFHSWLGSSNRSWLVVLDGVLDPADLRGLWPPNSGRTVITSRRTDLELADSTQVEVGVYEHHEAVEYLSQRLAAAAQRRSQTIDGAAELAEELRYHPLALAQAASAILNGRLGRTCREYLSRFRTKEMKLRELFPVVARADDYHLTVDTTSAMGLEAADNIEPRGLASGALLLAAVLDSDGIPATVWTTEAARNYLISYSLTSATGSAEGVTKTSPAPTQADYAQVSTFDAEAAIANLRLYSLIEFTIPEEDTPAADAATALIRTHALTQRATREHSGAEGLADAIWAAADALLEIWPEHQPTSLHAANLTALVAHSADAGHALISDALHPILIHGAGSLQDAGQIAAAISLTNALLNAVNNTLGPNHVDTFTIRGNLAVLRGQRGDHAGALADLTDVLADARSALGHDHPLTFSARLSLAYAQARLGDVAGAVLELDSLLTDSLRVFGPEHWQTTRVRADAAAIRTHLGGVTELETVVIDLINALGPTNPTTLGARVNLAMARAAAGAFEAAVAELEDVIADMNSTLGRGHPETLRARIILANMRRRDDSSINPTTEPEDLLEEVARALGADHPRTLQAKVALAIARAGAGDYATALCELEVLLGDLTRVFGHDHPETFIVRRTLGSLRAATGDYTTAVAELEILLGDMTRVFGPDHFETLTVRGIIAVLVGEERSTIADLQRAVAEKTDELGVDHPDTVGARSALGFVVGVAEDVTAKAEETVFDKTREFGNSHPQTLAVRTDLALARSQAGDHLGAVEDLKRILIDSTNGLGPNHPDTLAARTDLAIFRGLAGDRLVAMADLEDVLVDSIQELGLVHIQTLSIRTNMARIRGEEGDWPAAISDLVNVLSDSELSLGPDHPQTLATRHLIAFCREQAGGRDDAMREVEKLVIDMARVLGPNHPRTIAARRHLARYRSEQPDGQ